MTAVIFVISYIRTSFGPTTNIFSISFSVPTTLSGPPEIGPQSTPHVTHPCHRAFIAKHNFLSNIHAPGGPGRSVDRLNVFFVFFFAKFLAVLSLFHWFVSFRALLPSHQVSQKRSHQRRCDDNGDGDLHRFDKGSRHSSATQTRLEKSLITELLRRRRRRRRRRWQTMSNQPKHLQAKFEHVCLISRNIANPSHAKQASTVARCPRRRPE